MWGKEGKFCFFYVLEGEILNCTEYIVDTYYRRRTKSLGNGAPVARTKAASDTFAESAKKALSNKAPLVLVLVTGAESGPPFGIPQECESFFLLQCVRWTRGGRERERRRSMAAYRIIGRVFRTDFFFSSSGKPLFFGGQNLGQSPGTGRGVMP